MEREKVIKGLKQHRDGRFNSCDNCPYVNDTGCQFKLYSDALELLEEQPNVVKCEDCKYCVWATKTRISDCGKTGLIIKPGFYCAFGERMCSNA